MRAQIRNDAAGWDDPTCAELGCGVQAESEPTDLLKIRGNYTHDDTDVRGGTVQSQEFANDHGYKLIATVSMANDYNGYIATYRDFMSPRPLPQGAHRLGPALERLLRDAAHADGPRAQGRRRVAREDRRRDRSAEGRSRVGARDRQGGRRPGGRGRARARGGRGGRGGRRRLRRDAAGRRHRRCPDRAPAGGHRALRRGDLRVGRRQQLHGQPGRHGRAQGERPVAGSSPTRAARSP